MQIFRCYLTCWPKKPGRVQKGSGKSNLKVVIYRPKMLTNAFTSTMKGTYGKVCQGGPKNYYYLTLTL